MQHVGGCCVNPGSTPPGLLRNQPHSFGPKHQPAGTCRTGIIQPSQHSGRLRIRPKHPGHGHYGEAVSEHRRHHTAACRRPLQPTHRPTLMTRVANSAMPVRRDNAALPIARRASSRRRRGRLARKGSGSHDRIARPLLVRVANCSRWRRLPRATIAPVGLIRGPNWAETPKYCTRPIAAFTSAAISQALTASGHASEMACGLHNNQIARQASETSQGFVADEGPAQRQPSCCDCVHPLRKMEKPAPEAFGGVNSALQTSMHLFNSAKEPWRSTGRSWPGSPRRSLRPCTCRHWTGHKDDATTIGPHRPDPARPEPPRACG